MEPRMCVAIVTMGGDKITWWWSEHTIESVLPHLTQGQATSASKPTLCSPRLQLTSSQPRWRDHRPHLIISATAAPLLITHPSLLATKPTPATTTLPLRNRTATPTFLLIAEPQN
jgi:hypothetical protein